MYMMRAGEAHIFSSEQSDRLVALISIANLVVDISFLSFNLHSQAANVESWDKFLCSSFLHHTLSHFNWMQGWTQAFAIGLFPMVFQSFWPLWFIISYCFCIRLVGIGVSFFLLMYLWGLWCMYLSPYDLSENYILEIMWNLDMLTLVVLFQEHNCITSIQKDSEL